MDPACDDITADVYIGWIKHSKRFFPRFIALEDICCDEDEFVAQQTKHIVLRNGVRVVGWIGRWLYE